MTIGNGWQGSVSLFLHATLFSIVRFLYLHSLFHSAPVPLRRKTNACLRKMCECVFSLSLSFRFVRCSGSVRVLFPVSVSLLVCQTPSPFGLVVISNELTEKPNKNYFQLCVQVTCVSLCVNTECYSNVGTIFLSERLQLLLLHLSSYFYPLMMHHIRRYSNVLSQTFHATVNLCEQKRQQNRKKDAHTQNNNNNENSSFFFVVVVAFHSFTHSPPVCKRHSFNSWLNVYLFKKTFVCTCCRFIFLCWISYRKREREREKKHEKSERKKNHTKCFVLTLRDISSRTHIIYKQ